MTFTGPNCEKALCVFIFHGEGDIPNCVLVSAFTPCKQCYNVMLCIDETIIC